MAQLVARLVRNEKVGGSNPPSSTTEEAFRRGNVQVEGLFRAWTGLDTIFAGMAPKMAQSARESGSVFRGPAVGIVAAMVNRWVVAVLSTALLCLTGCTDQGHGDNADCHGVPNARLDTLTKHTMMDPVASAAVRSKNDKKTYIVAMRFELVGHDNRRDRIGIWSTSSLTRDVGFESLNMYAKRYSRWTHAAATGVDMSDHAVRRANRCVLPSSGD